MRALVFAIFFAAPAGIAFADEAKEQACDKQVALVMQAVNARAEGQSMRKTRTMLRKELDRTAGDALAEWIYALPEAQLTDAVGDAWKTQCMAAL
ncbi:hypothetical protein [Cognatishimia sp. F0-27]|uniref:hypothetical protein n=1 Tax=Cognatishimia sp. F0-27 TaxID=2816855 RepID=UPI001D0C4CD0|nr:hypothetical protein [Cognatishimia sp. F0-27]MCC1491727.1 hypothetical protein [Cognatishimia sp. F0-27]